MTARELLVDLARALRTLVRAPTFSLVAIGTLALGIGANTAIFSVVDAVLLRPLPYHEPGRLVTVWLDASQRGGAPRSWLAPEDLADLGSEEALFEAIGGWGAWAPTLTELGDPEVLRAAVVTEGLFERVLGVQPFLGRGFLPEEDDAAASGTVLLSHDFWSERLGGDRAVLGRALLLDGEPYRIVGVMPEGFRAPFPGEAVLWAAARLDPARCPRGCGALRALGRLGDGSSIDVTRAKAAALALRLRDVYPATHEGVSISVVGLREELTRPAARALWVLLVAVGLLLLTASANVANLVLVRGVTREEEFALREALGAGRRVIVRQLLVESLVLAAIGGLAALAVASWGTELLLRLSPATPAGLGEVRMGARVLAFSGLTTLGTGLLFGFGPALRLSSSQRRSGLHVLPRRGRPSGGPLRGGFVVTQIALSVVLLVGAGLLIRSVRELTTVDLGFDPDGVVTMRVALPEERFARPADRLAFHEELVARLGGLPQVLTAAGTSALPLGGGDERTGLSVEGEHSEVAGSVWLRRVTPAYFYAMGIRLLEGRTFDPDDDPRSTPVAIVNESLARRMPGHPERSPVGRRVSLGGRGAVAWRLIVGVVADTRHFGPRHEDAPAVYVPFGQEPSPTMTLVMRVDADLADLGSAARIAIADIDPTLATSAVRPLSDAVDASFEDDRLLTGLLGSFAGVALLFAVVGLYGVVSFSVTKRRPEMGLRLAVGARSGDVERLVLRGGLLLTATGAVLGLAGALTVSGVIEALLYGVSVRDPLTLGAVMGALVIVAALASWLPARHAGRTDPVSMLREE